MTTIASYLCVRRSRCGRASAPAGRRRGVTLPELIVVVLILGILGAMAAPRFSSAVQAARLEAACQAVRSDLQYLRGCAINRGRPVQIHFDAAAGRYFCPSVDHPDRPGQPLSVDIQETFDRAIELSADFAGQSTVTFNLGGVPCVDGDPIEQGRVTLTLGGGRSLAVTVTASGAVAPADANPGT